MSDRPYLLLDVDGPLNPYRAKTIPPGYELHEIREGDKTWKLLLNQQHGIELNALATTYELAWATTWEHGANRLIAPRLGLPELPVILWPSDARTTTSRNSWKAHCIAQWVGDREFAWVDDEVTDSDQTYFGSRALVRQIDATLGLSADDFAVLRAWAQ